LNLLFDALENTPKQQNTPETDNISEILPVNVPFQLGDEVDDEKFYVYVKECIRIIKSDWNEYSKLYLKKIINSFRKTKNIFTYRRYLKEPFKTILTDFILYILTKKNKKPDEELLKIGEAIVDKSWPVSLIVKDKNVIEEEQPKPVVMLGKKVRRKGTYEEYSSSQNESQENSQNINNNNENKKGNNENIQNNQLSLEEDNNCNNGEFEINTNGIKDNTDEDNDENYGIGKKYGIEEIKNKIEQKDKEKEKNNEIKNDNKEKEEQTNEKDKNNEEEEEEEGEDGENKENKEENKNDEINTNANEEEIKLDKGYTAIIDIFNYSAQRQCVELKENAPITKRSLLEYLPKKTIVSCFSTLLLDITGKSLEFHSISTEMSSFCKNIKRKIYFIDMDEYYYSFTLYNGSLIINKKFFDLMNDKKDKIQFGMCFFLLSVFHEMAFLLAVKLIKNLNFSIYYKNRKDIIETLGEHFEEILLGRKKRQREIKGKKIFYTTFGLLPLKNVKYITNYKNYIVEYNRFRRSFVKLHNDTPITTGDKIDINFIKYEKNDLNYTKINLKEGVYNNTKKFPFPN